jgi:hypothetical protein
MEISDQDKEEHSDHKQTTKWFRFKSWFKHSPFYILSNASGLFIGRIILGILIAVIAGLFILPAVLENRRISLLKEQGYDQILNAAHMDNNVDVRKVAAISLSQIDNDETSRILQQLLLNQPELSNLVSNLLSRDMNADEMILELRKARGNEYLRRRDQRERIENLMGQSTNILRQLRRWFTQDEITTFESEIVANLDLVSRIDTAIYTLEIIQVSMFDSTSERHAFVDVSNNLVSTIDKFILTTSGPQIDGNTTTNLINLLQDFNIIIGEARDRLVYQVDKGAETEVEKYKSIIRILANNGREKSVEEFERLVFDPETAHSIKLNAIEAIGMIGNESQIEILLETSNSSDADIRKASIISIGMILSNKRETSTFKLELYESN